MYLISEMASELHECARLSAAPDVRVDDLRKSIQQQNDREAKI